MPIDVPKGVDVQVSADKITVKGSNGTLTRATTGLVKVTHENGKVVFAPANESVAANAMSGTMRALVNNMVNGVSKGFEKKLTLVGVPPRRVYRTPDGGCHAKRIGCGR
jgi:large subunit ribosomal protein L6